MQIPAQYWVQINSLSQRIGHPQARRLSAKRDYGVELQQVSAFIARHSDHPGIISAEKWLSSWLSSPGEAVGAVHMSRLHNHGVTALGLLKTSAALFLLSCRRPSLVPLGDALAATIGHSVVHLAPLPQGRSGTRSSGKQFARVKPVPGRIKREVGQRIVQALGALLSNIVAGINAEEQQARQFTESLREPF